ncbi:hypothetical protein AVEN_115175-1 [Araneus ventricosus]|uniref:Uncharacterized protein n=1 Tax=Araneus ventricosus TaxID=182803 RepID=A0A4Y1ZXJ5_ARAVE|nr:hypothetical protein AVEN_115175-1 [Araneus ventricosus]
MIQRATDQYTTDLQWNRVSNLEALRLRSWHLTTRPPRPRSEIFRHGILVDVISCKLVSFVLIYDERRQNNTEWLGAPPHPRRYKSDLTPIYGISCLP